MVCKILKTHPYKRLFVDMVLQNENTHFKSLTPKGGILIYTETRSVFE